MEALPSYISITFGLTTLATLLLFVWALRNSTNQNLSGKSFFIGIALILWLAIQAFITLGGFYSTDTDRFPPAIMPLGILPGVITIVVLFATKKGRRFLDGLPLKHLTFLHTVRIPVEIVLYGLFLYKAIPELMTFEGRNFDILAGITAPFVGYFGVIKKKLGNTAILIWNFLCLGLLINIVVNALFSAPTSFQQFAFDQPNTAILYFPFSWLPTFIVPVVFLAHLAAIRQLLHRYWTKSKE